MQSFVTTPIVGGLKGQLFQDVFISDDNGNIVINAHQKTQLLKLDHPIKSIVVSADAIVDGITITYKFKDGKQTTVVHGSQFSDSKHAHTIHFNDNEIIASVFGRAGMQNQYERKMINNIGFVIFDTVKGTMRTLGPYGNSDGANDGKPFIVSDVIAFGGFADSGDSLGLSGLFFYKKGGKN